MQISKILGILKCVFFFLNYSSFEYNCLRMEWFRISSICVYLLSACFFFENCAFLILNLLRICLCKHSYAIKFNKSKTNNMFVKLFYTLWESDFCAFHQRGRMLIASEAFQIISRCRECNHQIQN